MYILVTPDMDTFTVTSLSQDDYLACECGDITVINPADGTMCVGKGEWVPVPTEAQWEAQMNPMADENENSGGWNAAPWTTEN